MMENFYKTIFPKKKTIIGMIHCAGNTGEIILKRALEELEVYESAGIDGAIIENYSGGPLQVENILNKSKKMKIKRGVNILDNQDKSFSLAYNTGCSFVQLDSVQSAHIDSNKLDGLRNKYPTIALIGGVRFKYKKPTGKNLEDDIIEGMNYCDVMCTTGDGTGIETPLEKLAAFREVLRDFPLISGAGVTVDNIEEQLRYTDGVIIGTYFKLNGQIEGRVDNQRVRKIMDKVKKFN